MIKVTQPWTVLSPAEKGGGLGVGLATLPRKNSCCYRNTNDKSTSIASSGRRASLAKVCDELQGKPKGSCNADYPSDNQENIKHRNMEHQNNV